MNRVLEKLPADFACVVIGPPLSGKKEMLYRYLADILKKKEPVMFITTDSSAEDVKKELLKQKIFYGAHKDNLVFIDCYSHQAGNLVDDTADTMRIPGPLALNEISIAISEIERTFYKKSPKHKVIFNSLSTLLMYSNPQMIGRFIQMMIAKIRKAGGAVFFTLEEGMHEQNVIVTIEHLMNAIIQVKKEKGRVMIKADGFDGVNEWVELSSP
jgi:KaiC/GvpD/RAD55 family RecA-like ATPase